MPHIQARAIRIRQSGISIEAALLPIMSWQNGLTPLVDIADPDLMAPWPADGGDYVVQPSGRVEWIDDCGRVLDVYDSLTDMMLDQQLMLTGPDPANDNVPDNDDRGAALT